ncbi:MAG: NERD domain-containing protein [Deltaproteobacteria bacterium]|nr:NERD domain-containing protein [Deltaproteobacteria bacterium]
MIIKAKDDSQEVLHRLDELKKLPLSVKQHFLVDREIKMFTAGVRGEKNSAYFLDFEWGNSPNWGIIHDLRIEHEGRIAQIDHLLINRYLEIYVLETIAA